MRKTSFEWVASDKTHCKGFDFQIPEEWVFGDTL